MMSGYINNPFIFNRLINWLWKTLLCPRGVHLFDEVLTDGDSYFVCDGCDCRATIYLWQRTDEDRKSDVRSLILAVRRMLDNIYEFGAPTDSIFVEQVEDALQRLTGDGAGEFVAVDTSCSGYHKGPFVITPEGQNRCVACRTDLGPSRRGRLAEPWDPEIK